MVKKEDRTNHPDMTHYRKTYKNSQKWDGKSEYDKIVVYCEQGIGDIIQFSRYIKFLPGEVYLHCPVSLHRLLGTIPNVKGFYDKEKEELPEHDCHVLTMEIPFLLNLPIDGEAYFSVPEADFEPEWPKAGITWEGSPFHPRNKERSCPLKWFLNLRERKYWMLQETVSIEDYAKDSDEFDLYGYDFTDWYTTAQLISGLDYVISVDTAVLHLAGSLGVRTFGILDYDYDWRWNIDPWYSSIYLVKQDKPGDWKSVFTKLSTLI